MDFFEKQDRARAKTKLLVLYYFLAIFFIVVSVYFLVFFSFTQTFGDQVQNTKIVHVQGLSSNPARYVSASLWQPQLFCLVAGIILLIVLSGSFYKISQLSSGGKVVALSLGGRLVLNDEGDLQLKKLLNVVDEMAIASGTPVPPVYLMENEAGINAFAAGFSQHDAVIGVTRGAVEQLDRDELQGVIAHEFSHILNGDMRLIFVLWE